MIAIQQGKFFHFAVKHYLGPFKDIPYRKVYEGNSTVHEYSSDLKYEHGFHTIKSSFQSSRSELKADPFLYFDKLVDTAKEFAQQQKLMIYKSISDLTDKTGNVVTGKITPESILEMIDRVELTFDKNDNPQFPTIHAGPEILQKIHEVLSEIDNSIDYKLRLDQIVNRKRKERDDRENSRKLVG